MLLSLLVLQSPLGQFVKLPLLVEHYIKHKERSDISFLTFLEDHYSTNHSDSDAKEDDSLPFNNSNIHFFAWAVLPATAKANPAPSLNASIKSPGLQHYFTRLYLRNIFHPPR